MSSSGDERDFRVQQTEQVGRRRALRLQSTPIGRVAIYVLCCILVAILVLVSGALLHGTLRLLDAAQSPPTERAYFVDPAAVDAGIDHGQVVDVAIVPSNNAGVGWRVLTNSLTLAQGHLLGTAGHVSVLPVYTDNAFPHSWLTIHVAGVHQPLRAWIK